MSSVTLNIANYAGLNVAVFWTKQIDSGCLVTGYTVTVAVPGGSTLGTTTAEAGAFTAPVTLSQALDPNVNYSVTLVANLTCGGQPSTVQAVTYLISCLPVIQSVSFDGVAMTLAWNLGSCLYPTNVERYFVGVYQGPVSLAQTSVDDPFATSAKLRPLPSSGGSLSVFLSAQGVNFGCNIAAVAPTIAINSVVPQLSSVAYNGLTLAATWVPPASPQLPLTGYTLTATSSDGGATFSGSVGAAGAFQGSLALPFPLDPARTYSVVVTALTAPGVGTATPSQALMTALPVLSSVDYAGTQVNAVWAPVASPTQPVSQYTLTAWSTQGGTAQVAHVTNLRATSGSIPSVQFPATLPYRFQLSLQSGIVTLATPPVPLLTTQPAVASAALSGDQLIVTWTPPSAPAVPVAGYAVMVSATGGQAFYAATGNPAATSLTVTLGSGFDPTLPYQVAVSALAAPGSTATSAASSLLLHLPTISSAVYNGTTVTATWEAPTSTAGITSWQLGVVSGNGGPSYQSATIPAATLTGSVSIPTLLDPGADYSLVLTAIGAGVSLATTPLSLLCELPALALVSNAGANVTATWTPVSSVGAPVSGYLLRATGTATNQEFYRSGLATTGTVAIPTGTVNVTVLATAGVVQAASQPVSLLTASPTVSNVSYDGSLLRVSWSGATLVQIAVLLNGAPVISQQASGNSWTAALALDPAQTYTVQLKSVAAPALGPPVTVPVLSAVPLISSVLYSLATQTLTVTWAALSNPPASVTGFAVGVFSGGKLVQAATPVTGGTSTSITITGLALAAALPYTVSVWTTGAGAAGPASGAVAVLPAPPALAEIDFNGTQVTLNWSPLLSPELLGYAVTVTPATGSPVTVTTQATSMTVTAAATATLTVSALADRSTGPGASCTLNGAAPILLSAGYDGAALALTWTPAGGAGALTVLQVLSSGSIVAAATVPEAAAALVLPGAFGSLQVQLASLVPASGTAPAARGPFTSPLTLLAAGPVWHTAGRDVLSNELTLTWFPASGASTYTLQLYSNGTPWGAPIAVSGTSWTSAVVPADTVLEAELTPAANSGGVGLTGPASSKLELAQSVPVLISAAYNGIALTAAWQPLAGASSYVLSLIDTASPNTAETLASLPGSETSCTVPLSPAHLRDEYEVVVQAVFGSQTAPASLPLSVSPSSLFVSGEPASSAFPHILPGRMPTSASGSDILLYLPELAASGSLANLPIVSGPFQLRASSVSAAFPYALLIPAGSEVWSFTGADNAAIRAGVQAAYISLLKAAETAGAGPYGISALQGACARGMPQTFPETLFYSYGLDLVAGTVDLRPGTVLQVASPEFLNPGAAAPAWSLGYAPGSTATFDVSSYLTPQGQWLVGFDSFLAQLVSSGALQVSTPSSVPPASGTPQTEAGVADSADLFFGQFCQPFFRLFFPPDLISPTGSGSLAPAQNFSLAAAGSYTALTETGNIPGGSNSVAYFRGRAVLKVGIRIFVNGTECIVPLGTTVGNVLDRYNAQPPSAAVPLTGLQLQRSMGAAVLGTAWPTGRETLPVRLDWQNLAVYGPAWNALALPLLHGDSLRFRAGEGA